MSKQYLIIGGNSTIGMEVIGKITSEGDYCTVIARDKPEKDFDNISVHQLNILEDDLPVDIIPEKLDGLLYLPGTITLKPFKSLKENDFHNDMQINFMGAVKAIKWAMKSLTMNHQASIVLLSTVAVKQGMPFHASIASAKGAVEGLIRALAAEYAPKVRVNGIAPSLTETNLSERLLSSDSKKQASADRHPLKRVGLPTDISEMACFLLSEKSSWITGQIIGVDGGLSTLKV
ncbi:MAG: SDR family oxidoreductase [Bacteroidetes bacterium]|jgi:NAD(P)-dependent dehydrogenase (short-subunit alcohol dehydrogenase family)|nr:SDR family oxidoreductase [Bacteroidota bacterium]